MHHFISFLTLNFIFCGQQLKTSCDFLEMFLIHFYFSEVATLEPVLPPRNANALKKVSLSIHQERNV
jgi:hypothetical protein